MTNTAFDLNDFTEAEQAEIVSLVMDEKKKILHRKELAKRKHTEYLNNVALLRIAADYLEWLHVYRRGSTFSTFVDEFGYDSTLAKAVYEKIQTLNRVMINMEFQSNTLYGDVDYPKPPYSVETEDD